MGVGSQQGPGPAALNPVTRNQLEGVSVAARQPSYGVSQNIGTANRQLASQIAQTIKPKQPPKRSSAYPKTSKKGS